MINHRQIAAACGVSTATVSRALNGYLHVRKEVREQVEAMAQKMGYEADPRLAYLSRLRWNHGRKTDSVTVAVLCDRFTTEGGDGKFEALERTAKDLGYQLEYVIMENVRQSGRNLGREFHHRGIRGLLISLHDPSAFLELEWGWFTVVMVGEERPELPFYRVGTDWRQAFDLLCNQAWAEGHRRIGVSLIRHAGAELNRLVLAEALLHLEELAERGAVPVPILRFEANDSSARRKYELWKREHRVECVLANDQHPQVWRVAQGGKRPRLLNLALSKKSFSEGFDGMDLQLGGRFALALRLLHDLMLLDRRGAAEQPTRTLYPVSLRINAAETLGQ